MDKFGKGTKNKDTKMNMEGQSLEQIDDEYWELLNYNENE